MAEQGSSPDNAGGAGAGGDAGSGQPGSQGGTGGAQPDVVHGSPTGLSVDILPETLRGKPASEVKFILQNMVNATKQTASLVEENRKLKSQIESRPKDEPAETKDQRPLEELILEDPEAAVAAIVEKRFGKDISTLRDGYGESMFHAVRAEIPDFREHEDTVRDILRESGSPNSKENIMGAYLMAVGQTTIEEKRRRKQEQDNLETSGAGKQGEEEDSKPQLTQLESEIARGLGLTDSEYMAEKEKYTKGTFEIKVPTGKPKEASNA